MEKKYYDLIVDLVKEHKKYPQYESVLDEIVNDVYEHSKVVLTSITNEDVLKTYLNKVVSTSIITVPKKMNFKKISEEKEFSLPINEHKKLQLINSDNLPEKNYQNNDENSVFEEVLATEELHPDDSELEDNDSIQAIEVEQNEFQEDSQDEPMVSNLKETVEDSSAQDIQENFHKNFVDNMINGIQADTLSQEIENLDEIEVSETIEENETFINLNNIPSEIIEIEEDNENLEFSDTQEFDILPETTESNENLELELEAEDFGLIENIEETVENNEIIEVEQIQSIEENSLDTIDEELETNDLETTEIEQIQDEENSLETIDEELKTNNIETIEVEQIQDEENIIENFEILETSELIEEISNEILENDLNEITTNIENEISEFSLYECFSFEPEKIEFDTEELLSELQELNEKYPEKQILTICDLKYNKKMSIDDISDTLNIDVSDIINTLNKIIDLMKD